MMRVEPGQLDLPLRFRHQQSVGRAHLALDGKLVSYTIKRSIRRRAISILIDEEGLRVGAPWHATHSAIERQLRKHTDWILRKLDEWQGRRAPRRRWEDGESLMLLGLPLTLKLVPESASIGIQGSTLIVAMTDPSDRTVAIRVHQWMYGQALLCFEERVAHFRGLLGVAPAPKVLLSGARTRWGSCHSSGRIHLNWRLIQMPTRLIDYVVAHEVAHLLEMNHSQRFWHTVGRLIPDYPVLRKELRREGHRYLLI